MTKLHEVVRGVEVKDILPMTTDYRYGKVTQRLLQVHNSLAQAEVVVSTDEIKSIMDKFVYVGTKGDTGIMLMTEVRDKIAQAIATAIENGAVLSLKRRVEMKQGKIY